MTKPAEPLTELNRALRRSEEAVKKALRESSPIRLEVEPSKGKEDDKSNELE